MPSLGNEEKIQLWASQPNEGNIIDDKANREKLHKAIVLLLVPEGCQFSSTDHLKEFVIAFAGPWGFHMNMQATTHLICTRNP
jgi:hypothetical protein